MSLSTNTCHQTPDYENHHNKINQKIFHDSLQVGKLCDQFSESFEAASIPDRDLFEAKFKAEYLSGQPLNFDTSNKAQQYREWKKQIQNYERNNGPIQFPTQSDLQAFLDSLPSTIVGSSKKYTPAEIAKKTVDIFCNHGSLDQLTSASGIRDQVENYMKGVLLQAAKIKPNIFSSRFNGDTGESITGFESRFEQAYRLVQFDKLSPSVKASFGPSGSLNLGYEKTSEAEKVAIIENIASLHGFKRRPSSQKHIYVTNEHLKEIKRQAHQEAPNINQVLLQIDSLACQYRASQEVNDLRTMNRLKADAMYLMDREKTALATEYKIHIHPQLDHVPLVYDRVLFAIKNDPILSQCVFEFKIDSVPRLFTEEEKEELSRLNDANDQGKKTGVKLEDVVPNIVLYTRRARTPEESKRIANRALKRIQELFSDIDQDFADTGLIPRESIPLSDGRTNSKMISFAQSGGNLKGDLRDMGLIDRYFDKKSGYAFMK